MNLLKNHLQSRKISQSTSKNDKLYPSAGKISILQEKKFYREELKCLVSLMRSQTPKF